MPSIYVSQSLIILCNSHCCFIEVKAKAEWDQVTHSVAPQSLWPLVPPSYVLCQNTDLLRALKSSYICLLGTVLHAYIISHIFFFFSRNCFNVVAFSFLWNDLSQRESFLELKVLSVSSWDSMPKNCSGRDIACSLFLFYISPRTKAPCGSTFCKWTHIHVPFAFQSFWTLSFLVLNEGVGPNDLPSVFQLASFMRLQVLRLQLWDCWRSWAFSAARGWQWPLGLLRFRQRGQVSGKWNQLHGRRAEC